MTTNTTELRKEAYRLWGLSGHKIVYDFPQSLSKANKQDFIFKFDFSPDKASWPRAYAIALSGQNNPETRIIAPILMIKEYPSFTIEGKAWYDMPIAVHEKIIQLIGEKEVRRKLKWYEKSWNVVGQNFPWLYFSGLVNIVNYKYTIARHNDELFIRVTA